MPRVSVLKYRLEERPGPDHPSRQGRAGCGSNVRGGRGPGRDPVGRRLGPVGHHRGRVLRGWWGQRHRSSRRLGRRTVGRGVRALAPAELVPPRRPDAGGRIRRPGGDEPVRRGRGIRRHDPHRPAGGDPRRAFAVRPAGPPIRGHPIQRLCAGRTGRTTVAAVSACVWAGWWWAPSMSSGVRIAPGVPGARTAFAFPTGTHAGTRQIVVFNVGSKRADLSVLAQTESGQDVVSGPNGVHRRQDGAHVPVRRPRRRRGVGRLDQ